MDGWMDGLRLAIRKLCKSERGNVKEAKSRAIHACVVVIA